MRLHFVVLVSLTIGFATSRAAPANLSLAEPTPAAAAAVMAIAGDQAQVRATTWQALTAPGSTAAPAADARRGWTVLEGWVKVPVLEKGEAGRPQRQAVPDDWPRDRDYQRAWYVLRADFGALPTESIWLRADAVAHECEAFINGRRIGNHVGGYTPFEFEITPSLKAGVNVIALYVRDEHAVEFAADQRAISQLGVTHTGGFTSAAGIRGGIYLEARRPVHVEHVLVRPSTRRQELQVDTWVQAASPGEAVVTHAVFEWPGGGVPILQFPAKRIQVPAEGVESKLRWADARRWSPEDPHLYTLRTTIEAGGKSETVETRFGFREFWTEGKSFVLNGTPIRLIGTSVARDLSSAETPDVGRRYARDALLYLKRQLNYRAMRLHASIHPRPAVEGADEAGVLLINQSSIWSAMGGYYQRGGEEFMRNMEREFAEWFWRDANAPSVVIWDVENEMIRDLRTPERERWVLQLDRFIKKWDPARIVEHSGAAWYSPQQETIHVHMQEQYAAVLRDWQRGGRVPLILGEFWAGGRGGETRLPNAREFANRLDWLQEESRIYREKILEMRNYGASGVMPFWLDRTALIRTNPGLRRSYDPRQDEIFRWPSGLRNLGGEALAPVIAFAWPRGTTVNAGSAVEKEIVVCNDRETPETFNVTCTFAGKRSNWRVTLAAAAQDRHRLSFPAATGELVVTVTDAAGQPCPGDALAIHLVSPPPTLTLARRLLVMPAPAPEVAAALQRLGLSYELPREIPRDAAHTLLLVPPAAPRDALGRDGVAVRRYLSAGGRMLILNQTEQPLWLPLALPFWPAMKKSAPEFTLLGWPETTRNLLFSREVPLFAPGHAILAGLAAADFQWWNPDDGRVSDDAFVRPGAVDSHAGGPFRVLAGATRRENASLLEVSCGEGTAIICQLQLVAQPAHPAATILAANLLRYLDGSGWRTKADRIGVTGDLTPARIARLTGLAPEDVVRVTQPAAAPDVVLAGDHAEPALVDALAREGRTVIVLSRETAGRLPGYAAGSSNRVIVGTRAGAVDDPLFWGISSGSFGPLENSPAKGTLTQFPTMARIALGGLSGPSFSRGGRRPGTSQFERMEMLDGDKPVAVVEVRGAGRIAVTTLEPWNAAAENHRQLLGTLLANAGVRLPSEGGRPPFIAVKATVPLVLDGRLDDWTNDMEDRNVSAFQHATPIILGSRDAVAGNVPNDAELSAVVYLLHDAKSVFVGGIVFGREPAQVELELGGHKVAIDVRRSAVALDRRPAEAGRIVLGRQTAREVSDTRLLALTSFNPQIGSLSAAIDTPGRTFEVAVPMAALGVAPGKELPATVRLVGGSGAILQSGSLSLRFESR